MTAVRGPRLQVGSAAWVGEERASALEIVQSEVDEFSYSAHNEVEWLNEHMAAILNENEVNITEAFKTPSKLRGKTPHTIRRANAAETRVPLSDVFRAASPSVSNNQPPAPTTRFQPPQLHQVAAKAIPLVTKPVSPQRHVFSPQRPPPPRAMQDSGYYGSQEFIATDPSEAAEPEDLASPYSDIVLPPGGSSIRRSPVRKIVSVSPTKTLPATKEDSTSHNLPDVPSDAAQDEPKISARDFDVDESSSEPAVTSPAPSSRNPPISVHQSDEPSDDEQSASEGSSPIRTVVRKSSLNFASLPAREPLTSGKSLGARQSRNSHFDNGNSSRTSYYQRQTGGKSLGNLAKHDSLHEDKADGMEVDAQDASPVYEASEADRPGVNHTKTYTQRLQDQISMLSKPQGSFGQTKQTLNAAATQQDSIQAQSVTSPKAPSADKEPVSTTPRHSPDDDDDDWIESPNTAKKAREAREAREAMETRPILTKSFTADIMEGIQDREDDDPLHADEQTSRGLFNAVKSASSSTMPTDSSALARDTAPLSKAISISNPSLAMSQDDFADTPSKSPTRGFRDSPLKQVKSKLSSILKSSRGLLATNADGKALMSPSTTRLALHAGPSSESVILKSQEMESQTVESASPTKPIARRTRASTEREKEQKRRENEVKRMEEQMDKLDKAREKEREKARAFTQEQEKVATMEKEIAAKRQDERLAIKPPSNPSKAGPSSPRKLRAGEPSQFRQADQDTDMSDSQPPMPPPSSSKPTQPGRGKDNKRPVKPVKEAPSKIKAPPTVIRVNTGSQHSQFQPAGSRVSTASHDTLNSNHSTASSKTSKSSYQAKSSVPKPAPASVGRSKGAELAARKKEQDERESQRRRDAKAEMEKKRIAAQEEQRKQDQQRRLELERQKQQEEEKKRQAAIEKAKQTRAPPPAVRSQPNGPPDSTLAQQRSAFSKAEGQPARPPSRLAGMRDDSSRPASTILSNAAKAGAKRTLGPETNDDTYSRPPPSRGAPAYHTKDSKRRRTSEHGEDESDVDNAPKFKGPPVRPSTGFKKVYLDLTCATYMDLQKTNNSQDLPTKSAFQNGYAAASHSATRDLFKAAVTAQHNSHIKAANPLDMAQISKGPIPFAPGSSAAGSSHKTPARPGQLASVKGSVRKASPRFPNGDSIELPEIQTDDDDDDDDETQGMNVAAWADSPDLRRALMRQETMDPSQIFGPPAPLIMEEVFNKSKDKWHKFRQRTSSANWSGLDRLTEDDIRKDMAARDKLRRDGGWSYEMSKDML
ncbi:Inner centromere protein [Trichoderma simmonsii]|uniref:Inner centromere protein n=1 Tax=Trichoderma simmonsii TaxID=1491479 RepID=A0A8G0P8P7_9HYPO|nr:Inner centromere protein [Trichoderma simmonsii]